MRRLLFIFLLLFGGRAWSATDLITAWQAARSHDPAFQGDQASARAGSQKEKQAQALWLPNIGLHAGAGYARMKSETTGATFSAPGLGSMSDAKFTTDVRDGRETQWGVNATQPIFNAARSAASYQLSGQARLAELQFRENEQQLFLRVAQRYFDVLMAEQALKTMQARKAAVHEALDIARERFNIGKSASTDMHEAQASYDAVVAEEFAAASDLELKRSLFSDLSGLPATGLAALADNPAFETLAPASLQALLERGMLESSQVRMSEAGRDIASYEIDKHRALTAASLDLVARYGDQRIDGRDNSSSVDTRSGSIGVQLTIPLFTGGMRSAKYEETVALADKARSDYELARQRAAQGIRVAWLSLQSGLQRNKALEQGRVSAQSKLESTQIGHEVGARTTADALNAQQSYYGVVNDLVRERYRVMLSTLNLAAALGGLDEAELRRVNAFLSK